MHAPARLVCLAALTLCFRALALDAGRPPDAGAGANRPAEAITLVVGGDVTLGFHYEDYFDQEVAKGKSRDEMFAWGFKNVRALAEGADLFLVNLECPFTARGEKIPKNFNFRARPDLIAALLSGNVGAVTIANNHMMDYGVEGLLDTVATLQQAKVPFFGAGNNLAEARRPLILTRRGVRIAFLGYFFLGDHNIEPAQVIATATTPGVAGHHDSVKVMEQMLREDIASAKTQAGLVIPFFHWGRETHHLPEPYQVQLAHAAIDAGAAAVLGSHPHVLQGMELYKGAPILYSLGNFVFGGNWNPQPKESAVWKARFSSAGYLSSEILPIQTDRYPEVPVQPFPLSGAPAEQVLRHLGEYSSGFPQTVSELRAWVHRAP